MALKIYPGLLPIGDGAFVAVTAIVALLPADSTDVPARTTLLLHGGEQLHSILTPQTVADRYAKAFVLLNEEETK